MQVSPLACANALRGFGADLGISAERVRQLEQQALETLHAAATQASTSS